MRLKSITFALFYHTVGATHLFEPHSGDSLVEKQIKQNNLSRIAATETKKLFLFHLIIPHT
jgi:hypothetical protein